MRVRKKEIIVKDEVIIGISSCKKYSYIWEPCLIMLRRYWPDCPYKICFVSDGECEYLAEKFDIIVYQMEKDIGFLNGYRYICEKNLNKYLIVLQDDFIIERPPDTNKIQGCKYIMDNDPKIGFIRFVPNPPPKCNFKNYPSEGGEILLGEIKKMDEFSFSWQSTLWNSRFFIQITEDIPARSFCEGFGNRNMNSYEGDKYLLCFPQLDNYLDGVMPYQPTAISEGKLEDFAIKLFKKENIILDNVKENVPWYLKNKILNK